MNKPTYTPQPIDTDEVQLSECLERLLERLAENTHDVWARGRLADGWRYGPTRSDPDKLHPCLVPYDDLPESEKEYDRKTAGEALKAVIALGYNIQPQDNQS